MNGTEILDNPIQLCVFVFEEIAQQLDDHFNVPDFASFDNARGTLQPIGARITRTIVQFDTAYANEMFCADIFGPVSLYPIMRVEDWENHKHVDNLSSDEKAALFVGAALYAFSMVILFVLIIFELVLKISSIRIWILVLACGFSMTRFIYFMLVGFGEVETNSTGEMVLAMLPVFMFFSMCLLLLFYWIELTHFVVSVQTKLEKMKPWFIGLNIGVYLIFGLYLLLFGVFQLSEDDDDEISSCLENDEEQTSSEVVAIVFNALIAGLSLILACAFFFYGLSVWRRMVSGVNSSPIAKKRLIATFGFLILSCTLSLLGQCAISLYYAADQEDTSNLTLTESACIFIGLEIPALIAVMIMFGRKAFVAVTSSESSSQ